MKIDHRLQALQRIGYLLKRLHHMKFGQIQPVVENRAEQALLAVDMMIKASLRQTRCVGDFAHRGIVVAFTVKYLGRDLKNTISRKIAVTVSLFCPFGTHSDRPTDRSVG